VMGTTYSDGLVLAFRFENGGQFLHGFLRCDYAISLARLRFYASLASRSRGLGVFVLRFELKQFLPGLRRPDTQGLLLAAWSALTSPSLSTPSGWSTPAISLSKFCLLTSTWASFEYSSAITVSTTSTGKQIWTPLIPLQPPPSLAIESAASTTLTWPSPKPASGKPTTPSTTCLACRYLHLARCAVTRLTPQSVSSLNFVTD